MDIKEIFLAVLIVLLVVMIGVAGAKDITYHCEVHEEVKRNELITIGRGEYIKTICIKCLVDFAEENLPELYRVEGEY